MSEEFWQTLKTKDHPNLSLEERTVMGIFRSFRNGENKIFPGQKYLAFELGRSERTTREVLLSLQEKGYIRITQRGQGKTNIYELVQTSNNCLSGVQTSKIRRSGAAKSSGLKGGYHYMNIKEETVAAASAVPEEPPAAFPSSLEPETTDAPIPLASLPSAKVKASSLPYDQAAARAKLVDDKQRHIRVIGLYFSYKEELDLPSYALLEKAIARNVKVAKDIAAFENQQIDAAFQWVVEAKGEGGEWEWRTNWKLEDVLEILENKLYNLNPKKKSKR